MSVTPGSTLGCYAILAPIGAGAMGEVWRARDARLGREVALKVLPDEFAQDEERLQRFEREAKALASLNHPNVAQIFGIDQVGDTCFLVLELVPGETLEERVRRGPLSIDEALDVSRQIAKGLEAAHEAGVIHRDLKPANVRITPDGKVKVLDFGLAKPVKAGREPGSTSDSVLSTEAGRLLGTPTYMAPEQARGRPIDRRVDVWAFGCVLFECLTGQRTFDGETLTDVLAAVVEREPDWTRLPERTPRHVRELLARCLAKDPRERLRDMGDAALLHDALASELHAAGGVARPRLLWIALPLSAALVAAGWWARRAPPAAEPPRVTQLAFSGDDHQPHVSPDGRLIAFTSGRAGSSQIWLRQVLGGGEQPLTEGPDWRPRFTPDGTAVSFVRSLGASYAGFQVPVVGGRPRKLIDDVTEIDWSPDGRRLGFARGAAGSGVDWAAQVGWLDPESGEQRTLLRLVGWDLFGLSWSPDGKRMSVARSTIQGASLDWRVLLVDAETGAVEEVAAQGGLLSGASWSGPSGLVFARAATGVTGTPLAGRIVHFDLETAEERTLLWASDLFPFRGSLNATTVLTPVGDDALVFDTCHQTQTLHEVELAPGSVLRRMSTGVSVDRQPCYSPDGGRVLFTSNRAGNVDLFTYDRSSGEIQQLTHHPASDWDGAFTPDGKLLWSSDRGGSLEIWTADADGTNPRQLSHDGIDAENPTITRDGRWIVYSTGHPDHPGIFRMRSDGSETTLLIPGNWIQPEVSPDGRYVLYVGADNALLRNTVLVSEVETGKQTPFHVEIAFTPRSPNVTYGRGRWTPDGRAIVHVAIDEHGRTGLATQDFHPDRNAPETRRALVGFDGECVYESFGIAPDGRALTFSTIEQVRTIHLADHLTGMR